MLALAPHIVETLVRHALTEDLGTGGDLTTTSVVPAERQARATARARHAMTVCGGDVFAAAFVALDPMVTVSVVVPDGATASAGDALWRVEGPARSVLSAERVALNFVQRMTGVATLARTYVDALTPGTSTRIADTRKTTPGLRVLERYAVRVGGAHNHRDNLASAVMIKDNHIVAAGTIAAAVQGARDHAPHTARVEVEVDTLEQLGEALAAGADIVMLDNMDTSTVREALGEVERFAEGRGGRRPIVEASGGITLERVAELSEAGVDVISVGALTHSAPAADISLELSFA